MDIDLDLLEALALSTDRQGALAALLPGTALHEYWSAIHLQHQGRLDEVDPILAGWEARFPDEIEPRIRLERKQLLLRAATDLPAYAETIRFKAGLAFDDQAEAEIAAQRYPTRLDPSVIDPEALVQDALGRATNLQFVTDWPLANLVPHAGELDLAQRRDLLGRLPRGNVPGVVALIAAELGEPSSRGLDALPILRLLTEAQLHELAALRPTLRQESLWVQSVLTRRVPPSHVDRTHDRGARRAFLDDLWTFVEPLAPSFNGLKAQVLHHRLDLDRQLGTFDRDRFLRYLELPRATAYTNQDWLRRVPSDQLVRGGASPFPVPGLEPVGDDEALVRDHLQVFLATEGVDAFADRLVRAYLDKQLAVARLLAGDPDARRFTGMLAESEATALRERVDLELSPRNPTIFGAADPVSLEVIVKNVPTLVVKVFRINVLSHFLARGTEVDTTLDLDGMVASDETTLTFDTPSIVQTRVTIDLPGCARPGTYVIELIGSGMSSRALVRKGSLRHTARIGAAGVAIRIFDEAGKPVPEARIWLGGRECAAADDGEVRIPFSTQPNRTPILLVHGDLAQREVLDHPAESYSLYAGLHLESQTLVAGKTARILLRPLLSLAGAIAPLALLEGPQVEITVTDLLGVSSTKTEAVTLRSDAETVVEVRVPEDAAQIGVRLRAKVRVVSTQQTIDLDDGDTAAINGIHATGETEALHLATTEAGHVLSLLGTAGEPRPGRAITLRLKHAAVTLERMITLSTDERGRIELGPLDGVEQVSTGDTSWSIWPNVSRPRALSAESGATLTLPAPPFLAPNELPFAVCLTELRQGLPARDCTDRVRLDRRALVITGLEPGQYSLSCRGFATPTILEITPVAVAPASGWSTTGRVMTELSAPLPIVRSLSAEGDTLVARISGAGPETRVHLIATRFRPSSALTRTLDLPARPPRTQPVPPVVSDYVSGRDIGDEYRYILARRTAPKRPGMLLEKPSLLLNPWALRTTENQVQTAKAGGAYGAAPPRSAAPAPAARPVPQSLAGLASAGASYDFLREGAVILANLRPDADGLIRVARADLGDAQTVQLVVIDPALCSSAELPLPETEPNHRDRRLRLALDANGHFAEERRIEPLPAGQSIVVEDLRTGKLELIDTLARAHQVLLTLSGNDTLRELTFVTRWPSLDAVEQARLYSKYACHELHLFLARKDPAFFARVIRPSLADKLHKTFIDRFLLEEDLRAFLDPWAFGQLNALEQVLLAQSLPEQRASIARLIGHAVDRIPPDPEGDARLVDTLLGAAGLEGGGVVGAAALALDGLSYVLSDEEEAAAPTPISRAKRAMRRSADEGESLEAPKMMASFGMPPPMSPGAMGGAMRETLVGGRGGGGRAEMDEADLRERKQAAPLFRSADKTQEWAETGYWQARIAELTPDRIAPNRFLRDLALHPGGPFLSPHLGDCAGSFTAALTALGFLDLPFIAATHDLVIDDTRLTLTAKSHALAARTRITSVGEPASRGPILVGQGYVRADDPIVWDGNEGREKYVTGELLSGVVYRCGVTVTNPTSATLRLDVLQQIPRGALPVDSGFVTRTRHLHLAPYGTEAFGYAFYFPFPGVFSHFPAHVLKGGELEAFAPPSTLTVVREPTESDTGSWAHVSQKGTTEDVVRFLAQENLGRIDLTRIAFRMRDRDAFTRITALLAERKVFEDKLWSYGLFHADRERTIAWLRHQRLFLDSGGPVLEGALVPIDPVERGAYQHLEYAPLINARAHPLGKRRRVLNDALATQYRAFLDLLAHRATPSADDLLAAAHYAFSLERVDDALAILDRVDAGQVTAHLQYDYLAAYAASCRGDLATARRLAAPKLDHPVDRWRFRFAALVAMVDEAEGRGTEPGELAGGAVDPDSRDRAMAELAARQPTLELLIDQGRLLVQHRNLPSCRVHFYRMDLELVFSRQPFVQGDVERFSFIDPGDTSEIALDPSGRTAVPIPSPLAGKNLVVSASAPGLRRSIAYYAHDLAIEVADRYGQIRVTRASSRAALSAAYVKVYARMNNGSVSFFKDGYTDLRGRFDHATLSTDDLDRVERFALLVVSTDAGATVLEAPPPPR